MCGKAPKTPAPVKAEKPVARKEQNAKFNLGTKAEQKTGTTDGVVNTAAATDQVVSAGLGSIKSMLKKL